MRALVVAIAVMVSGAAWAADRCLLVVDGRTYINGPCRISVSPGGSFQAASKLYFADVQLNGSGAASGYWNEEPGAGHAHTRLGELVRNDACWTNEKAIVCAWR